MQFEEIVLPDQQVAISVHTSKVFDLQSTTKDAAIELNNLLSENMTSVTLSHSYVQGRTAPNHYIRSSEVDIPILSYHGNHKLVLPNLTSAYLSGGHFHICLRNAFVDIAKTKQTYNRPIDLHFVTEAVYVEHKAIRNSNPDGPSQIRQYPVSEAIKDMTTNEIVEFVQRSLGLPSGNKTFPQRLLAEDFKVNIYLEEAHLGAYGEGAREVNVRLVSLNTLKQRFK